MIDYFLNDHLSVLAVISLIVVFILYTLNENLFNFESKNQTVSQKNQVKRNDDPLSEIFYEYKHKSERDWAQWIGTQKKSVKIQALQLLHDHLEGPSKHWGYVTLEALGAMTEFKDEGGEHLVSRFFIESGKLWGEYKSIPNYYSKAAEILVTMNPQLALKCFSNEIERKSSLQSELERKKIIINALPRLESFGIGLMISVLTNTKEVFAIRNIALRTTANFDEEFYQRIILETLKFYIARFAHNAKTPQENEIELLEDLFKEAAKYIGENEFLQIFDLACKSGSTIQEIALTPLMERIKTEKDQLAITEIYAMTLLRDNDNQRLRQALASIHELEADEIENICMETIREEPIIEDILRAQGLQEAYLPIPKAFTKQYDSFKKLFEPNPIQANGCQKAYGGVLITGDNEVEKLYFAKRYAKEFNLNFGYVNIANINNKDDYNKTINTFNELRKPYLLYIDHPELMYPSNKSPTANFRIKFGQALYIQALDTKSYLVGSIKQSSKEIQSETTLMAISQLKMNFFAQVIEMNLEDERFKVSIIEEYFRHISPHRQGEKMSLAQQLYEKGKAYNCLEFSFLALKTLATMLLVYGRCMPLRNIDKLQDRLSIKHSLKTEQ